MSLRIKDPNRFLKSSVIITLAFFICCGLALVLAQIKPFWVDEWRVIHNLKTKTPAALFGPLDYMQQFPRVYLLLIKLFTAPFDYSYFTLRVPSFIVGCSAILLAYKLMKQYYPERHLNKFLFVMVLVSSYTFTEYFIQIKQYTMDIFLALVAMAQLTELIRLYRNEYSKKRYLWLCAGSFIVPFFSYTYPIAILPVFGVVLFQNIVNRELDIRQWICLFFSATGIALFYFIDVAQLMHDKDMQNFWGSHIAAGWNWEKVYTNVFLLFAQVGSGLVFNIVFGVLGLLSFFWGLWKTAQLLQKPQNDKMLYLQLYSTGVLLVALAAFFAGKLPLGEPRLNVFTVPAIAVLLVSLLDHLRHKVRFARYSVAVSALLYVGVIGNIYTTFIAGITGNEYHKRLAIYEATEDAIIEAQARQLPILITPGVAFPYENTENLPFSTTIPGDWVLKTFPAYKMDERTPVYALKTLADAAQCMKQLPSSVKAVMVGDGVNYRMIARQ